MLKVVNIVGARPQFIKYFPISSALEKITPTNSKVSVKDILVHTGQHYDYAMSKIFFDELGIKEPDYHLEVGSGLHGRQTGLMLQKIEELLLKEKPHIVIVYGDTNSTLAGALAASKLHIPIAHIEAGLRSFNKYMPEETNRILTDHTSTILFCPNQTAIDNLVKEGFKRVLSFKEIKDNIKIDINNPFIINVGDVMYDTLLHAIKIAEKQSTILETLNILNHDYCVLTIHRADSTEIPEKLKEIVSFVNNISAGKTVIFPMHPRWKKIYEQYKIMFSDNIKIIEPLGYFDNIILLKNSSLVMTDSGGVQKEAFWLKVPCITLRDETEWVETISLGWNILYKDYKNTNKLSQNGNTNCYGDGTASEKIATLILKTAQLGEEK